MRARRDPIQLRIKKSCDRGSNVCAGPWKAGGLRLGGESRGPEGGGDSACDHRLSLSLSVSVCQEPTPEVAGGAWQWQRSKETHLSSLCWRPWNGCSNLSLRLATCPVLLCVRGNSPGSFQNFAPHSLNPFFSLDWFNNWLLLFATKIVLMSVNPCFWWCYFIYLYPAT